MDPLATPNPTPEPTPTAAPAAEPTMSAPAAPLEASTPVEPATPASPETPVTDAAPAPVTSAPAPETAAAPTPGGQPKRILLVEDDDALATVYMTRLQAENFDVRRVANGEDALASALNFHPDLIILDVMMPKVSGFDVLDILRNTPETANLKIVMLTALSQESDKERAENLGVDEYLVKSQVVIADVIDRIKHHLGLN